MKRMITIVLGTLVVSASVMAQGGRGTPAAPPPPLEPGASQADVDQALVAAPGNLKDQATVIKWKHHQTYTPLRKGENRRVC